MPRDIDQPDPRLVAQLVKRYEATARRMRELIIPPPGSSDSARQWNQARAASILAQVDRELAALKKKTAQWTGTMLTGAVKQGVEAADLQADQAGVRPPESPLRGSFHVVDSKAVEVVARDTLADLNSATDSMRRQTSDALGRMAAEGVTNKEVNDILTGGVIEGKPTAAIRDLREKLKTVHGNKVTITDRNGSPMEFDAGYYAKMVAVTKTRQATVKARHERLRERGIDLVKITGKISKNFCTAYVGKVFSISGAHPEYPPLSSLPGGGPPFHPNCSKGTAPFIEALADPQKLADAKPDPDTRSMLNEQNRSALQKKYEALKLGAKVQDRRRRSHTDAGKRVMTRSDDEPARQESILRQWGAEEVELNGHSEVGEPIVRGMQKVVSAGGTVPRRIIVDRRLFKKPGETRINRDHIGFYDPETDEMAFNPDWHGWRDRRKTMRQLHGDDTLASSHHLHPIFHEAAHAHAAARSVNWDKRPLTKTQVAVARKVSLYATTSRDEFIAEVRAARMAGVRFDQDVMTLWHELDQKAQGVNR